MTTPAVTVRQRYWNGLRVPYVTAWTGERVRQPDVIRIAGIGGEGIGYADEDPVADRRHEALWVRGVLAQGRGKPDFSRVSSLRQKRAVRYELCQVCGESVVGQRADERSLHLLAGDAPIAEGETTAAPPVHPGCALEAIGNCPHLRRHAVALVEFTPLWGVAGVVYDPVTLEPLPGVGRRPDDLTHVYVGDERIRWTLASFTVVSLHGVVPVSAEQLHEMAEADARTRSAGGLLYGAARTGRGPERGPDARC